MFKSFNIKNFRGFKDFSIDSLGRINLVIGQNNIGKTALLEGLFLLLGSNNAHLPLRLNTFRGLDTFPLEAEEIWGWLFYNRQIDSPIQLEAIDKHDIKHTLSIKLETSATEVSSGKEGNLILGQKLISTTESENKTLLLNYSNNKNTYKAQARIIAGGIEHSAGSFSPFSPSYYLGSNIRTPIQDSVNLFSKLERDGKHEEIISTLKIIEPDLKRLAVSYIGGIPNIFADIGRKPLLPITFMGEGINKLLSILLSIASSPNGCVLIDEIENGLHYSVMTTVWQAIGDLVKKLNTQLVITTHSLECIQSAEQVCEQSEDYNFKLYRLERADKEIRVIKYDQQDLETSLELGWEVR